MVVSGDTILIRDEASPDCTQSAVRITSEHELTATDIGLMFLQFLQCWGNHIVCFIHRRQKKHAAENDDFESQPISSQDSPSDTMAGSRVEHIDMSPGVYEDPSIFHSITQKTDNVGHSCTVYFCSCVRCGCCKYFFGFTRDG
eukprot:TRINITY_DN2738_c0_g2_i2.p1 TRINITY_DN2738_c0_g2~~TRINITY_DN2738_c0_g2_i2.p1  ORF type:complete len:143 (+),score=13.77 TRINITY_DN2738_c0_g2_i2:940-1368(+)